MDVREAFEQIVDLDLECADLGATREGLTRAGRMQAWLDAFRIAARRRLEDLAREGTPLVPDQEFARASNATARDTAQNADRDKTLGMLPVLGEAFRDGAITGAHVDGLARGLRQLEPADRQALIAAEGARLARLAERQTPDQFARTVKDAVAEAQSDGGIANFDKQRRANRLRWWFDQITGMLHLSGEFDPESALKLTGRLRNLVEELFHGQTPDTCPTDPSLKQDHLRALALIALVEQHTTTNASGQPAASGPASARVDLIVVADEQTLRTGLHQHSIIDPGHPDAVLPVETLRRLACMANIIPAVLDSNGVVTDLGRSTRLASREQRRALRAMYPSCGIHGCRVPFEQCVIHHIRYWENLGPSDLDNMIPLCSKHHHCAHEGGWQLHLHPGTRALTVTHPDGSIQTTGPPHARAG